MEGTYTEVPAFDRYAVARDVETVSKFVAAHARTIAAVQRANYDPTVRVRPVSKSRKGQAYDAAYRISTIVGCDRVHDVAGLSRTVAAGFEWLNRTISAEAVAEAREQAAAR